MLYINLTAATISAESKKISLVDFVVISKAYLASKYFLYS